jgi:acetyl esterase/lipase
MRQTHSILLPLMLLAGCGGQEGPPLAKPASNGVAHEEVRKPSILAPGAAPGPAGAKLSLAEARRGFQTRSAQHQPAGKPAPEPPPSVFRLVRYDSPVGKLAAYLTPDPGDGRKHPGIVWITGGDCNTIDELWTEAPRDNDQTAAAYRQAGIIMMFPSLRGGNDNPGQHEGFFGEVDDVLAAADYLSRQAYVDPKRIYLGGHSTGGTLVMLVAESTDRLRAVFSFGPVDDVRGYPGEFLPFDRSNPKEFELRSPGRWLNSVRSPLFVFEGTVESNLASLQTMASASTNPLIRFLPVKGVNHFSILAPTNELIAAKILRDEAPTTQIAFSEQELSEIGSGVSTTSVSSVPRTSPSRPRSSAPKGRRPKSRSPK